MADPLDESRENPIVALATRLRHKRDIERAIDSALDTDLTKGRPADDAGARLAELGAEMQLAAKRLNSILGPSAGVKFIRLERPLRLRLRFGEKRISLDLDSERQLVIVAGEKLDGEYQFDTGAETPTLINLSQLSTEAGYGEGISASILLKTIARDAQLPRPAHLDGSGPISL